MGAGSNTLLLTASHQILITTLSAPTEARYAGSLLDHPIILLGLWEVFHRNRVEYLETSS